LKPVFGRDQPLGELTTYNAPPGPLVGWGGDTPAHTLPAYVDLINRRDYVSLEHCEGFMAQIECDILLI